MNSRLVYSTDKQPDREKKNCPLCDELVRFYNDGTIEKHKTYLYKKIKDKFVKTTQFAWCTQRRWS